MGCGGQEKYLSRRCSMSQSYLIGLLTIVSTCPLGCKVGWLVGRRCFFFGGKVSRLGWWVWLELEGMYIYIYTYMMGKDLGLDDFWV